MNLRLIVPLAVRRQGIARSLLRSTLTAARSFGEVGDRFQLGKISFLPKAIRRLYQNFSDGTLSAL